MTPSSNCTVIIFATSGSGFHHVGVLRMVRTHVGGHLAGYSAELRESRHVEPQLCGCGAKAGS